MHEFAIAQSVLETVHGAAADHGGGRVRAVYLRIGELCQVVGPILTEAFAVASAGTAAEGASLKIDWVPTQWRCDVCGQCRPAGDGDDRCSCGATDDRLEGSDELLVTSLDLD
ncbi:MAG: hydrogenase maturation nickel metallochaperone HypA [bacterium]|nr:hydrogenase maturation nickel metallochaperone HypA [bacterium]